MAGQPVRLTRLPPGNYEIHALTGLYIGRASHPGDLREPGGVLRKAETHYPLRAKPRGGYRFERWLCEVNAWRKAHGMGPL